MVTIILGVISILLLNLIIYTIGYQKGSLDSLLEVDRMIDELNEYQEKRRKDLSRAIDDILQKRKEQELDKPTFKRNGVKLERDKKTR